MRIFRSFIASDNVHYVSKKRAWSPALSSKPSLPLVFRSLISEALRAPAEAFLSFH